MQNPIRLEIEVKLELFTSGKNDLKLCLTWL